MNHLSPATERSALLNDNRFLRERLTEAQQLIAAATYGRSERQNHRELLQAAAIELEAANRASWLCERIRAVLASG